MTWYKKWQGSLPYSVEELSFNHSEFNSLLVTNESIKAAEKLLSGINKTMGRTYYIIGNRGVGKSTSLNYMMRWNLDIHYSNKSNYVDAICILCPIPRTSSPKNDRELSENIMIGIFGGIKKSFTQDEVKNFLRNNYREIFDAVTNKILEFDEKKGEFRHQQLEDCINEILLKFSECYPNIILLIDDLDKTEDVNMALKALWSYQALFNDWKRSYRVILVISGKEEWIYSFEDIAEYSGIKGTNIALNDWKASDTEKLLKKRLETLQIIPSPFTEEAYFKFEELGIITPRDILTTSEKVLNRAAKTRVHKIGPSLIEEIYYWNMKKIKSLRELNQKNQNIWVKISQTISRNQNLEKMPFGILIEAASRDFILPMADILSGDIRLKIPKLKILKQRLLNIDNLVENIKFLVNKNLLTYNKKKKAYQVVQEIRDYLKELIGTFGINHLHEIVNIDQIFESKSSAIASTQPLKRETQIRRESIERVILTHLNEIFQEDPSLTIDFDELYNFLLKTRPDLKNLPGNSLDFFTKQLNELKNKGKVISPELGSARWKKTHNEAEKIIPLIRDNSLKIAIDTIWSAFKLGDEVLSIITVLKTLDDMIHKIGLVLGDNYDISDRKLYVSLLKELKLKNVYLQNLNILFSIANEEIVKNSIQKEESIPNINRKIYDDPNVVSSSLTGMTGTLFPKIENLLLQLKNLKDRETKIDSTYEYDREKGLERDKFNENMIEIYNDLISPQDNIKINKIIFKVFNTIFENLRTKGYLKYSMLNNHLEKFGLKVIQSLNNKKLLNKGNLFSCQEGVWKVLIPYVNDVEIDEIVCTRTNCTMTGCSAFLNPKEKDLILSTMNFNLSYGKIWMEELIKLFANFYGFHARTGLYYPPENTVLKDKIEIDCILVIGSRRIIIECKNRDLLEADWNDWNELCDAIILEDKNADIGLITYSGFSKVKLRRRTDKPVEAIEWINLPERLFEIWENELLKLS